MADHKMKISHSRLNVALTTTT